MYVAPQEPSVKSRRWQWSRWRLEARLRRVREERGRISVRVFATSAQRMGPEQREPDRRDAVGLSSLEAECETQSIIELADLRS